MVAGCTGMGYLGKAAASAFLVAGLVSSNVNAAFTEDSFPFRFESKYEVRANVEEGRGADIGELEKNVSGYVEMQTREVGENYFVDFSARSESDLLKFSYKSKYKLFEGSDNVYRSLDNILKGEIDFGFLSLDETIKYSFEYLGDDAMLRIKKNREKEFTVPEDTMGLFALLANFFSDDCYAVGKHYVGKMKGNNNTDAGSVEIDVIRRGEGYLAEMIIPEDVLWKKTLPVRLYYVKDGDVADIYRMEVFVAKKLWMFDKWFIITPVGD